MRRGGEQTTFFASAPKASGSTLRGPWSRVDALPLRPCGMPFDEVGIDAAEDHGTFL